MPPDIPSITILSVPMVSLSLDAALTEIGQLLAGDKPSMVAFANAHTLNLAIADPAFRDVLCRAELVCNDGIGVSMAARLRGLRFPANLNGTDLSPRILRIAARQGAPVFFLGGAAGIAAVAAERLNRIIPGLIVAGTADGYADLADLPRLLNTIRSSQAKLLFVGLGNPRQELWLAEHLADTGATVGIGVGAFLDFAASRVRRAPAWMRAARIEWLFRLALEPRRLFRRYVTGNPLFLYRVARERIASPGRGA
jgi:exopolysaccharide biosynthesis WecB/TagA/CpsF family protein